ncbi:MAG: MFS transporter [Dehalococcoidia bacterium]|nr:MFS transporter [Dehalococcoidia bacterium]
MKNFPALLTLYSAAFVAGCSLSWLFPVVPLYAAELGAPVSQVGLIVATYSYVTALLLIPLGMLSDRLGLHKFVIVGLAIFALAPLLYPLAANPQQLIIVRAIHGLSAAAYLPAAVALATDLAPAAQRGEAIGWYTMSFHLGLMAGPITGGFMLDRFGFAAAFYSCSAVSLLGLVFVLCRLGTITQPSVVERTRSSSWGWMKQALAFAALLMPLFIAIGAGTLGTYMPLYGQGFGITAAGAGAIITATYASSALLRAPAGRLSDRVGRKPMIVCGMAVTAVAAGFISAFHSLSPLIIVAIFFGIGMGLAMPAGLAVVADLSSAGQRGLAMAMPTCFFQIGLAVGPTAMGFVAEASSFEVMFLACASSLALGLFVILGLMRMGKG